MLAAASCLNLLPHKDMKAAEPQLQGRQSYRYSDYLLSSEQHAHNTQAHLRRQLRVSVGSVRVALHESQCTIILLYLKQGLGTDSVHHIGI